MSIENKYIPFIPPEDAKEQKLEKPEKPQLSPEGERELKPCFQEADKQLYALMFGYDAAAEKALHEAFLKGLALFIAELGQEAGTAAYKLRLEEFGAGTYIKFVVKRKTGEMLPAEDQK